MKILILIVVCGLMAGCNLFRSVKKVKDLEVSTEQNGVNVSSLETRKTLTLTNLTTGFEAVITTDSPFTISPNGDFNGKGAKIEMKGRSKLLQNVQDSSSNQRDSIKTSAKQTVKQTENVDTVTKSKVDWWGNLPFILLGAGVLYLAYRLFIKK